MKAALFLTIFYLVSIFPASAADNSPAGEISTARISELYSNLESFDVSLYSNQPADNLSLEVFLLKPTGTHEEILEKKVLSVDGFPEDTRVIKVGFWNIRNPQRGAYALRARLLSGEKILSEAKYDFVYGSNSASKIRVNDLVPNSQGISVVLSPKEASLFDVEYMLVDNSSVSYFTKSENLSLTSIPSVFSASWGIILENNKEYAGRVKIQVYSPEKQFISSTEKFIARDNAEITDIFQDETGASATVFGRSQVPFEGNLIFSVYKLTESSGIENSTLVESIRERVPVLLSDNDETVEVAWSQRLPKGVYRLEIELLGNDEDVIERRETILESDLSGVFDGNSINDSTSETKASNGNSIPGFTAVALISGLIAIVFFLRKQK